MDSVRSEPLLLAICLGLLGGDNDSDEDVAPLISSVPSQGFGLANSDTGFDDGLSCSL